MTSSDEALVILLFGYGIGLLTGGLITSLIWLAT